MHEVLRKTFAQPPPPSTVHSPKRPSLAPPRALAPLRGRLALRPGLCVYPANTREKVGKMRFIRKKMKFFLKKSKKTRANLTDMVYNIG
jgi:hypothetical protein